MSVCKTKSLTESLCFALVLIFSQTAIAQVRYKIYNNGIYSAMRRMLSNSQNTRI